MEDATSQAARPVLLKLAQVRDMTSMSTTAIYDRMNAGRFPRPVGIGMGHGKRWIEAEVDAWVLARIAERDAGAQEAK